MICIYKKIENMLVTFESAVLKFLNKKFGTARYASGEYVYTQSLRHEQDVTQLYLYLGCKKI